MEMEMLSVGDICETGRKNSKNMWIRIDKLCVGIERWETR
jgi:hypothetical protein